MTWFIWAALLMLQTMASTFNSRARNSGSVGRHIAASMVSNGIWFAAQFILIGKMTDLISGSHGWQQAAMTGLFYTACTVAGAIAGHRISMATEAGMSVVGASKKFAQIPIEDWKRVQALLEKPL